MSLLDLYNDYVKPMKGSPRYHCWSILTVISALLERRVWVDRGRFGLLFPNQYVLLIGPPATGKSMSAMVATDLYTCVQGPPGQPSPTLGPSKITQAALYEELHARERTVNFSGRKPAKQSPVFIFASELAVTMADFGGGSLTNELIDFYDSKGLNSTMMKRTIGHGPLLLHNPSLCLLGGTTQGYMQLAAKSGLITSGLGSRIVFVVENNVVPKERRQISVDTTARTLLISMLSKVYAMRGEMTMMPEAIEAHIAIAESADLKSASGGSDLMLNYLGRKPDHALKVAMALAASDGRYRITPEDIIQAGKLLSGLEHDMVGAFGLRNIGQDDLAPQYIQNVMPLGNWRTRGEIHGDLMAQGLLMPHNAMWEAIIKSMELSGTIKSSQAGGDSSYMRLK